MYSRLILQLLSTPMNINQDQNGDIAFIFTLQKLKVGAMVSVWEKIILPHLARAIKINSQWYYFLEPQTFLIFSHEGFSNLLLMSTRILGGKQIVGRILQKMTTMKVLKNSNGTGILRINHETTKI